MAPWKEGPSKRRERRYGLTEGRFNAIMKEQGGFCAICKDRPPTDVDHSQKTGHFRGLLCRPCNLGLGMFRDDPDLMAKAIAYLQTPTIRLAERIPKRPHPNKGKSLPKGEDCHSSKLTDKLVRRIRAEYAAGGVSYVELAAKYGFHSGTLGLVVRRKIWQHVE